MKRLTTILSAMLLLLGVTAAQAQSQIPGSLDLSTTVVDAGTGTLHDGAGWDGSKIDWMTKGNMATIKFENTKGGTKFKILSYGGTNQSNVVVGFSILDSKGNVVYDQTTEPYASGGFGDKKKNASLPVTDALAAGKYELMLYYDNLDEGGSLTVNITQIEFVDADEYKEDEPAPTPGGVGLNVPCDLDLSKAVLSTLASSTSFHYMADGDENCPRLDYPHPGDVATFNIKATKTMAYKMSFNYATPMDGMFMTWVIKDATGKEVYNQMFNIDPTGAPGDFWTIYKDFDNIPETDELPAGDYTFIMYYNVDQQGNIVNGSYDGAENGAFHINIKRITFANAAGGESFDIDLSTVDTSESQGNKTLHYMADGDENCPRLDYPSAGDVAKFKVDIAKESAYKMGFNYATPMDGMFMTWILTNADGQEVYNQMFNIDPTGAPGDFWTIYKDFDNIPETDVLKPGRYTLTMKYNIDQQGNIVKGSYDGAENGNFHINIKSITFTAAGASAGGKTITLSVDNLNKEASNNDLYQFNDADGFTLGMENRDVNRNPRTWKLDATGEEFTPKGLNFKKNAVGTINIPAGQKVVKLEMGGDSESTAGNLCYVYSIDVDGTNVFTEPIGKDATENSTIQNTAKYPIMPDGNDPLFASVDLATPAQQSIAVVFSGNNQVNVWFRVTLASEGGPQHTAQVSDITIDGQTVTAGEDKYDYECSLPKTYTEAKTTLKVASQYAKISIHAADEDSSSEVAVTDNGDGTYTLDTPQLGKATILTLTVTAEAGATEQKQQYTMRLFHAAELMLSSLLVDGVAVDPAIRTAINKGDAYTATIAGQVFTKLPTVTATANDGTSPQVSSQLSGNTAVYSIQGDNHVFTLRIEGINIYQRGENDEDYLITYNLANKEAYEAAGQWTEGWTDGLYTLRTTNLDGWNNAQFKFNAADNLIEVPGGVVVKTFTLERFGANYGDGEGLTSISSEGATFLVPTKHGFTRGGRDTLTVIVENHKPGAPIAFTLTGGNQPYAQIRLVIEKTNPGTAPKVVKQAANVSRNHAMVTVSFDREMAPCSVVFQGKEYVSNSGAVLTFGIDDLAFAQQYAFTIPAGAAQDLFGNKTTEDITVNIQTEARKAVEKKTFDYVVGTPEEFTAAIKAIGNSNKTDLERVTIFLKDGDYNFGANNEQRLNRGNVSLIGQSRNGVTIRGVRDGISNPILNLRDREGFYLQDMTLQNDHDFGTNEGVIQAVAVYGGNKTIMKNIRMNGNQDTQVTGERAYFDRCEIHGMVDFICGGGNNFYDQCDLVIENRGGCVIAAPNNSPEWGYVFSGCTIKAADNAPLATDGSYYLGRPWQPVPRIYYINTRMELLPADAGWTSMGTMETHFYEYGSTDRDGNLLDLSVRRNSPTSTNTYVPTITADEAKRFTVINVLGGTDGWLPTDYTVLPAAPKATLNGSLISWNDDDQVRCWVIFKDGKYVANTTNNSYLAPEEGVYTIRSANEMGGLSTDEARVPIGATAISAPSDSAAEAPAYNLSGQRVSPAYRGMVISQGRKQMQR